MPISSASIRQSTRPTGPTVPEVPAFKSSARLLKYLPAAAIARMDAWNTWQNQKAALDNYSWDSGLSQSRPNADAAGRVFAEKWPKPPEPSAAEKAAYKAATKKLEAVIKAEKKAAPTPAFDSRSWRVQYQFFGNNHVSGLLTPDQIRKDVVGKHFKATASLWDSGSEQWIPLRKFPELQALLRSR
ncbi:MAG: hypothetical protein Q8N23_19140 [Archangium sp.]|nr:hypothetical protein [Archangium sp.]MDP3154802.1 hypothetical protein [Archangium sp.]MDP3575062.1 hypothetical protein [Archangium sp.]